MLTAILFDDEKPALYMLERRLRDTGLVQVLGAHQTYGGFLDAVRAQKPDVVFMDIEIPEKGGISTASELLKILPETDVVFVTADRQYALEAFELNAVDYLLKPVRAERLMRTLERLCKKHHIHTGEFHTPHFAVRCMGKFSLPNFEGGSVRWPTQKAQELLAFLWCNRRGTVSSAVLAETLWPALDNVRARNNLYTTVYSAKKALKQFCGNLMEIDKCSGGYRLVTTLESDEEQIETLLKSMGQGAFEEDLRHYRQVMLLYSGHLFEAEGYGWAQNRQAFLLELFQKYGLRLSNRLLGENRWREAQEILQYLLLRDPCCESAYIFLVRTHARAGDVAGTHQCYTQYCNMMRNEFAVEPRRLDDILRAGNVSPRR